MSSIRNSFGVIAAMLGLSAATLAASGCKTEAFCFDDCGDQTSSEASTTTATGTGGSGGTGGSECILNCGGAGGEGECVETNMGVERCDGTDNNCDGTIDNVDFNDPASCGTCSNNCYALAVNCKVTGTQCIPSSDPGVLAGTCQCTDCADDYYDSDGDGLTCEYPCVKTSSNDTICDAKDNDCDNLVDEDVDLCSPTDCGSCGKVCAFIHASGQCTHTDANPCGSGNTKCDFTCDCVPGDCWWDANGLSNDGCEYPCDLSNGGVEICDGIDNDCDGLIDGADDLSGDGAIGVVCFGDPDGECAKAAHAGTTVCQAGQIACSGANVLHENEVLEICNLLDDDCDGTADDFPIDAGGACGANNIFPCSAGTLQCQNGLLNCVGSIGPQTETCNSVDDDCDGVIDSAAGMPPSDSVGACNTPPAAPAGATQPCQPGMKACQGGNVACVGSVGPTAAVDSCGDDSNCDGSLDNQPDLVNDVTNCGSCGNDCYVGSVHSTWACVNGMCLFQGCQNGYFDLDGDQICEYACIFVQAQETCNGIDDNCNGVIDENVTAPSPVQVCGVSPAASAAECTSQVSVTCQNGAWQCTFPGSVCSPNCAAATEVCDTLDNNCNGLVNENVPNYNQPCASDDANPVPGDGACRTTGTYVCSGGSATICSAVKASCANLPNGCTETCDGIDNDCDGSTDETYLAKGTNATFFVKPAVTKIAASSWMMTYEASRPNATSSAPGSGNGYHTSAPVGETLDKTIACSVPTKIPWYNVTPDEVTQTCLARGGRICTGGPNSGGLTLGDYRRACGFLTGCTWAYGPAGGSPANCASVANGNKFCNLGATFDFDANAPGNQDGLLPTSSAALLNCYADYVGVFGNVSPTDKIFDLTGNLREITKSNKAPNPGGQSCTKTTDCASAVCTAGICAPEKQKYPLMGGSFLSQDENGATCTYDFYLVDSTFKFYDTGFRCCYDVDPTL